MKFGLKQIGVLTLIVIGLIAAVSLFRSCDGDPLPTKVIVPIGAVSIVDSTPTVSTLTTLPGTDTAIIARLHQRIDSLQCEVSALGARRVFTTDTLYLVEDMHTEGVPDTIVIECDETNKAITLEYGFAPRIVAVPCPGKPWIQGYAQAGVMMNMNTALPRVSVGALLEITRNMGLAVAVETRLGGQVVGQLNTALTADLRWTF